MLQGGVVMRYQGDDEWFLPKVYHNGAWQYCLPYVFSSNIWKLAGAAGVPMVRFVYDNQPFLVRKERLVNYSQSDILNWIYPVGSIYMSMDSENPTNKFGGTWEQIQGQFLLGVNSAHTVGSSGGAETASHSHSTIAATSGSHTLTVEEMPAHYHDSMNWRSPTGNKFGVNAPSTSNPSNTSWRFTYTGATAEGLFYTGYTGGDSGHTHPIPSLSTDSQEINIMPPYTAVYIWKRTA